jgi:hypothetical protein
MKHKITINNYLISHYIIIFKLKILLKSYIIGSCKKWINIPMNFDGLAFNKFSFNIYKWLIYIQMRDFIMGDTNDKQILCHGNIAK